MKVIAEMTAKLDDMPMKQHPHNPQRDAMVLSHHSRIFYLFENRSHLTARSIARPDLVNIFKLFIPQLLSYPNPTDPLNGEAAALLMRDPEAYANRIKECVRLHASDPVHLDGTPVVPPPPPSTSTSPTTPARSGGGGSSHGAAATGAGAVATRSSSSASIGGATSEAGRPADEDDKPAESSATASTSRGAPSGEGSSSACPVGSSSREGDVGASGGSDGDNMVVADDDGDGVGAGGDMMNKVGEADEHMKRRKSSSADTNDGAGSSSASEYLEVWASYLSVCRQYQSQCGRSGDRHVAPCSGTSKVLAPLQYELWPACSTPVSYPPLRDIACRRGDDIAPVRSGRSHNTPRSLGVRAHVLAGYFQPVTDQMRVLESSVRCTVV